MKILKNYVYNVSYQIFIIIVPLITTPYVGRVLGSYGVGINAYTNSVITYFVLFGSVGVSLYGNRTIAYQRDNKDQLSKSFWEITIMRFLTIAIAYFALMPFLLITSKYRYYYVAQSWQLLAAALDISWLFMGLEDFSKTVIRNIIIKFLSVVLIFTLVKNRNDTGVYILILSLSTLFGNLTLWPYLKKYVYFPGLHKLNIKRHFLPSIELFIPQIATQIYLVLNKTMLGSIVGVKSAGYFDYSDRIVKLILAISTATGAVMLPRMANVFSRGDFKKLHMFLYRSFDFVTLISVPLMIGLASVSYKFAPWFMGNSFRITAKLIPLESFVILMIGWSTVFGTQYLLPVGRNREFTFSVTVGAVVNLVFNIPLISLLGVYGAVISTVLSETLVSVIQIYFVRNEVSLHKLFEDLWKYLVAGLVMGIIVLSLNIVMQANVLSFAFQILVGALVYTACILTLKPNIVLFLIGFLKKG
jgi:O-antigen/teichoic acid export membrane protein